MNEEKKNLCIPEGGKKGEKKNYKTYTRVWTDPDNTLKLPVNFKWMPCKSICAHIQNYGLIKLLNTVGGFQGIKREIHICY